MQLQYPGPSGHSRLTHSDNDVVAGTSLLAPKPWGLSELTHWLQHQHAAACRVHQRTCSKWLLA
eukprot:7571523-Alexandrium_andersonii.AAC.1